MLLLKFRNEGQWTKVGAEKFHKPDNSSVFDFDDADPGTVPETWRVINGSSTAMEIGSDGQDHFLRATASQEPLLNLAPFDPPWTPEELTVEIRLPEKNQEGAGVIIGYENPENFYRVYLVASDAIRISRFADGAVTNDEGDIFEFRMVDSNNRPFRNSNNPVLTLSVPPGHIGGTFVETPGRIGPFQASNDDLYFIIEPAETDNMLMVIKSTDNGASWQEADGDNRPDEDDPPTQVATMAIRSDGSIVAVYGGPPQAPLQNRIHRWHMEQRGVYCGPRQ